MRDVLRLFTIPVRVPGQAGVAVDAALLQRDPERSKIAFLEDVHA